MKFVQIIEFKTSKPDEVQAVVDEFLAAIGKLIETKARTE